MNVSIYERVPDSGNWWIAARYEDYFIRRKIGDRLFAQLLQVVLNGRPDLIETIFETIPSSVVIKKKKMGFVYLIEAPLYPDITVKIGRTTSPANRFTTLQQTLLTEIKLIHVFLCDNPTKVENCLHRYFHRRKIKGEWFKLNKYEINTLKEIVYLSENRQYQYFGEETRRKLIGLGLHFLEETSLGAINAKTHLNAPQAHPESDGNKKPPLQLVKGQ